MTRTITLILLLDFVLLLVGKDDDARKGGGAIRSRCRGLTLSQQSKIPKISSAYNTSNT